MSLQTLIEVTDAFIGGADVPNETVEAILNLANDIYYNGESEGQYDIPILDTDMQIDSTIKADVRDVQDFLTDTQFNNLERLYKSANPDSEYFTKIGSDVRGGKVPLPFTMGSLDQVYDGDIERWIEQNKLEDEYFVLSDKLDGTSGAVVFDKRGIFNSAFSRGNGTLGADITRHIRKVKGVPTKTTGVAYKFRNEAIIPIKRWPEVRDKTQKLTGRLYKNARNYVAGKMNASETDQIFADNVDIVVTSMEYPEAGKVTQLETARKEGFKVPYYEVVSGRHLTTAFLTDYLTKRRAETEYEIDGIVVDIDNLDVRNSLPRTSSSINPTYAKKFKIGDDSNLAVAKVVNVLWRPSKAGYLKPRVEIEPVDLAGVTITFATGFNAKFIRDNSIGPGAEIQITRSGDVIPFITHVVSPAKEPSLPDEAEFGPMVWTTKDVDLVLENPNQNEDVTFYRVLDFFTSIEVPNLKGGAVEKLIAAGIDTEEKIIKATEADLKKAVGNSAGSKIYNGIKEKLNPIELHVLAGASQTLGRGVGKRKLLRIIQAYGSLDVTLAQICEVEGFQDKTASLVYGNLPKFKDFLVSIDGYYTLATPTEKPSTGSLDAFTVVFTGVRDKDFQAFIEANAGNIGSGVNSSTTHLICKDPSDNSSKLKKARDLGVKIVSLTEAKKEFGFV